MGFVYVERPNLLIARRVGEVGEVEMADFLERSRHICEQAGVRAAIVYDAGRTPDGRPNSKARSYAAHWLNEHAHLLQRKCAGMDFVFPTPLSRGILTAITWIRPLPMASRVHERCDTAVQSALDRIGARFPVGEILREIDALEAAHRADADRSIG
ncbi:MAG: hypothetical protein GX614_02250 [Sandaracinaceae bacterium]|nr:hypothetical protein [Sandaracinaceae bacterium]